MTAAISRTTAHQRPYKGFVRRSTMGLLHGRSNRYMASVDDMSNITIWHNPRCSKSRQTLQLIRDRGLEPTIVEYLKTPPSRAELRGALRALGITPRELIRRKEALYAELSLDDDSLTDADLVGAMLENPNLIERPVVLRGERAIVGRPPENVIALLD